jgi:hypothetical protein
MGLFDSLFKKKSQSEILKETLEKGSAEEFIKQIQIVS